jgi:hypothetical protein
VRAIVPSANGRSLRIDTNQDANLRKVLLWLLGGDEQAVLGLDVSREAMTPCAETQTVPVS